AGRIAVFVEDDLLEVEFAHQQLTGGIVDRVEYTGGREHLFAVSLGPRFREFTQDTSDPRRLTMEFESAPLARADAETPPSVPSAATELTGEPATPVIVIDPGHGGQNIGAEGPNGTVEKEITLQIAQKLRASVLANLGYRVFLTRSTDQEVDNDERPAIANNYKADLFISIHANASRRGGAKGSEVYFLSYQATDDESRRLALAEGAALPPESSGEDSPLSMILWDMAQADHLEESSRLASRVQEELAAVTGVKDRGIKQAPFRVLVGAAMPAVLVEVAFISHPEEEQLLNSSAYQWRLASALMRGIARFMAQREQRLGALARP
ncbi:MAG TPA: N-acetylmuramoyl-L-alanine amidase, partial [Candidatus Krumholzibacteria bacterium]